jgi:hypothetical protein
MSRERSASDAGRRRGLRDLAREIFAIDLRSLAAFRVAVAAVLLTDLGLRARNLSALYSDAGILPREAVAGDFAGTLPSLHALGGSAGYQAALFALAAICAGLLLIGWHTRLFTFASWLLLQSLHRRNFMVLETADDILLLGLLWSVFLPLGARLSLDARRSGTSGGGSVSSPASAALLLQVAFVYFFSGWMKTGPEWTTERSAIAYALGHEYWARPLAQLTRGFPEALRLLTPAVLWFERLAPILLFSPLANARLRVLLVLAFWGLMLGLGLHIDLGLIPWASSVAMVPFLPAPVWERLGWHGEGAQTGSRPGPRSWPARGLEAALLGALALVVWTNVGTLAAPLAPPDALRRLAVALQLQQSWYMYAPSPPRTQYWIELRGRLAHGASVDLLAPGAAAGVAWERVLRSQRDHRFRIHLERLLTRKWPRRPRHYARWLCAEWNRDASAARRLARVAVVGGYARFEPEGGTGPAWRHTLADLACPEGTLDRVSRSQTRSSSPRAAD